MSGKGRKETSTDAMSLYGVPYPFVLVIRFSTHHCTTEGCVSPEEAQRRIDELLAEFPTFRIQVLYQGTRDVGPFTKGADVTSILGGGA